MKLKTKHITVTAVMIALSIVVIQFIKAPLMIAGQNVAISGALINLILIIDTLYCGLVSGIILSVIIPVFSFILTQSPLISAVPVILQMHHDWKHCFRSFCLVCKKQKNRT